MPVDLSQYSDEELMKIAGGQSQGKDLSQYSDDELMKIAGVESKPKISDIFNPKSYTPEAIGGRFKQAGQEAYREVVSPIMSGISTAAFGIPKMLADKAKLKEALFPEQQSIPGKVARGVAESAGFMVGGPAKLGAKAVSKFMPKVATKVLPKMAKGAIQYGTAGGSVVPEKTLTQSPGNTIKEALFKTVTGAGLGAGGEAIGAGVNRVTSDIKNLNQVRTAIKNTQTEFGTTELPQSVLPRKIGEKITESKQSLSSLKNNFKNIIKTESKTSSEAMKSELRKFGSKLSNSYDKGLEEIDRLINVQNKTTDVGAVGKDWVENALQKVKDNPEAVSRIKGFAENNGFKVNQIPDEFGNPVWRVFHPEKMNDTIGFKELVNLKNSFKKGGMHSNISSSLTSGTGSKSSDVAYHAMQDSWGEFLQKNYKLASNESTEIFDKFLKLQKDYAPLASAKWKAFKVFKPYDYQNLETSRGAKFLENLIGNPEKENLLKIIEEGSDFSPGIGDMISSRLKSLKSLQGQSESKAGQSLTDLIQKRSNVQDLLAKEKALPDRVKQAKTFGKKAIGAGAIGYGSYVLGKNLFKN